MVTDTSNGVVLYSQEMVGGERAKKVAAEAAAHPDWFSYLYTQAEMARRRPKGEGEGPRPRGHDAAGRGDHRDRLRGAEARRVAGCDKPRKRRGPDCRPKAAPARASTTRIRSTCFGNGRRRGRRRCGCYKYHA